jgi:hypothetical protein
VELVLASIRTQAFSVEAAAIHLTHELPDPDDAPFLECAQTAGVPLATGNTRRFPKPATKGMSVLTPAKFVASRRGAAGSVSAQPQASGFCDG